MRVRILREAHDDIKAGRLFYDSQEQGVGAYFSSTIYADIWSLRNFGGIHPKRHGYHMMLVRRFPFAGGLPRKQSFANDPSAYTSLRTDPVGREDVPKRGDGDDWFDDSVMNPCGAQFIVLANENFLKQNLIADQCKSITKEVDSVDDWSALDAVQLNTVRELLLGKLNGLSCWSTFEDGAEYTSWLDLDGRDVRYKTTNECLMSTYDASGRLVRKDYCNDAWAPTPRTTDAPSNEEFCITKEQKREEC